jgi:antitoxin component YwqK of YwqJK toxin-antitoxin module
MITHNDDGSIRSEKVWVGDHHVLRYYHKNGQLATEMPLHGHLVNGVVKEWNEAGKFLGSYELRLGCGQASRWHFDGTLASECEMLDGVPNGRCRIWDKTGQVISDDFNLNGVEVSRSRYNKACVQNPRLRRYPEEP